MDRRKLRFPEYHERLTVRLPYGQRAKLRKVAQETGVSESELVREAIEITIQALVDQEPKQAPV